MWRHLFWLNIVFGWIPLFEFIFSRHKCMSLKLFCIGWHSDEVLSWSNILFRNLIIAPSRMTIRGPYLGLQSFLGGLRSQSTLLDTTFHSNTVCQTASTVSATWNRFQCLSLIKYSSEVVLVLQVLKSESRPSVPT